MPTPKQGYTLGTLKLPSVTTVLGRFKNSGALMQWAFQQGASGASSLYEKRDEAGDIGTRAHRMIENHINEDDLMDGVALDEKTILAEQAYKQYRQWESQTKIVMLSKYQELRLICPRLKFGGTPDAIGMIDNEIVLLDWKTSNGVYSDYLVQLAAYVYLVNNGVRMDDGEPVGLKVTDTVHLLRFSKETPDFAHHKYTGLEDAWRLFELYLEAYSIDKRLAKRV